MNSVSQKTNDFVNISVKFDKSFEARISLSSIETKKIYSELKNEILSYKKVKSRISWRYEKFSLGRQKLFQFVIRGKNLYLYLALDPSSLQNSKYRIKDVSNKKQYYSYPTAYKVNNDLRVKYAKELIKIVMEQFGVERINIKKVNYVSKYKYNSIEKLIENGYIRDLDSQRIEMNKNLFEENNSLDEEENKVEEPKVEEKTNKFKSIMVKKVPTWVSALSIGAVAVAIFIITVCLYF